MSEAIIFVPVKKTEELKAIYSRIGEWCNLRYLASGFEAKVQSLSNADDGLYLAFPGILPGEGPGLLEFELEQVRYQIEGEITPAGEQFLFKNSTLFREQKRRLTRIAVPENYPAHFAVTNVGGEEQQFMMKILDIHGDGFQLIGPASIPLKAGSRLQGIVQIKTFPEVKVGGHVRHCERNSENVMVGVEIRHLDFGSEDKLQELLLFYRHDVFYFNKNKAGS